MEERFIERGTSFPLRNGKLSLYETNCICKDVKFYFDQFVLTLMLAGHKTIVSKNLKFEFFPGTFFIPEKGTVNNVSIPNASKDNPTKCLVLELEPNFIESFYEEIISGEESESVLYNGTVDSSETYFLSNDNLLIKAFVRLFELQFKDNSSSKSYVEDLILKEILIRTFQTEGLYLLKENFDHCVYNSSIKNVVSFINNNIDRTITTKELAGIAKMGQTTFFTKFKRATGYTPIEYVLRERIKHSKILIQKDKLSLQEIAYKAGFNSYEYFCSSFKKIESIRPSEFRNLRVSS